MRGADIAARAATVVTALLPSHHSVQQPVDAGAGNPSCLAIAAGPMPCARMAATVAAWMDGLRPVYFPSLLALAIPSRCRSRMISRSHAATPIRMVNMSFDVGFRVSNLSPPIDRITTPTPRPVNSSAIWSNCVVLRASRSGLVTISTSPSRADLSEAIR